MAHSRNHVQSGSDDDLRGVFNPDFLALGLGGTNMMAMLWSVAMGRRAVGVELRGEPSLGVHWNIREDLYHQLGLLDEMMLARYGEEGVPRRGDGRICRLADCLYTPETEAGHVSAEEVVSCFYPGQHLCGTIEHIEFIDDRVRDGVPNRVITVTPPATPPMKPDPSKIRTDMVDVLDGPSTFQSAASEFLKLLRIYLEAIEEMDLARGLENPRVRLFQHHRVVPGDADGFLTTLDGRKFVRIEQVRELDYRGKFVRTREPNSKTIDIGVPELFMIAQGFSSYDAERLGFKQHDVEVDHNDGRGPVVAQADYLAGFIEVLVDGRLRRRIASTFDKEGNEYWVRQIAVGHEGDPEVGWVLVQVPDFKTFNPIEEGLVPPDTDPRSPEFFAGYQQALYDFFVQETAAVLELPTEHVAKLQMDYGPKLFSIVERVGDDPRVARNGVVAGDSFGNGHFLTSGGANTGMVGHSYRVLRYWQDRDAGKAPEEAIMPLASGIKSDTVAWLHVSAAEFSQAAPINFGAERIQQIAEASGIDQTRRASSIDASRRTRHELVTLDYSDWRRLFIRGGRLQTGSLPPLSPVHPELRMSESDSDKTQELVFAAPAAPAGPDAVA